jgi:hypothetical protein
VSLDRRFLARLSAIRPARTVMSIWCRQRDARTGGDRLDRLSEEEGDESDCADALRYIDRAGVGRVLAASSAGVLTMTSIRRIQAL